MNNKSILIIFTSLLLSVMSTPLFAGDIVVVVHPSNNINTMTQDEIRRIYLGKNKLFKNGSSVEPIDAKKRSPRRLKFYKKIVEKSPAQISSYWSRLIFTGKGAPPRVIDSDDEILDWVGNHENSIAYINKELVTNDVKVVFVLP